MAPTTTSGRRMAISLRHPQTFATNARNAAFVVMIQVYLASGCGRVSDDANGGPPETGVAGDAGTDAVADVDASTDATTLDQLVAAGAAHTCVVSTGSLYCWGDNEYGQVGIGKHGGVVLKPTLIVG